MFRLTDGTARISHDSSLLFSPGTSYLMVEESQSFRERESAHGGKKAQATTSPWPGVEPSTSDSWAKSSIEHGALPKLSNLVVGPSCPKCYSSFVWSYEKPATSQLHFFTRSWFMIVLVVDYLTLLGNAPSLIVIWIFISTLRYYSCLSWDPTSGMFLLSSINQI